MNNFLLKLFVKDYSNTNDSRVREAYGVLGSIVGIICNIILSISKLVIGTIFSSISITADALNNISDAGSAIVTFFGFKMAARPADKEHPYGHGRMEYVVGFIVSFLILLVGFELGKTSVEKIIKPEEVLFGSALVIVLLFSIVVKFGMSLFNKDLGKRINSATLKAMAQDSFNDSLTTAVVLLSAVITKFTGVNIDGYTSLAVSIFIFYSGIKIFKDTLNPLLGEKPSPELVDAIKEKLMSYEGIVGVHDLIVHNYGPGKIFASVHAEVPAENDILQSHGIIDLAERKIAKELNILLTIHMDPIETDNEFVNELKALTNEIIKNIDPSINCHDFRIVKAETHTNIIFDVVIPFNYKKTDCELKYEIDSKFKQLEINYYTVITVDREYT